MAYINTFDAKAELLCRIQQSASKTKNTPGTSELLSYFLSNFELLNREHVDD
jgi:hypothetical protein